jgi:hypothetical protein
VWGGGEGGRARHTFVELKVRHGSKQLGQLLSNCHGVVPLTEDLEQVSRRNEVEARERETLRVEVLLESLLAHGESVLHALELLVHLVLVRALDDVVDLGASSDKLFEVDLWVQPKTHSVAKDDKQEEEEEQQQQENVAEKKEAVCGRA